MKKIVKLIMPAFLAFAVLFVMPTAFRAEAATEGYLTYKVENGEATITDCDDSISGSFAIPSKLGGYPVTVIGSYAFNECTGLTSITIPNSVTSIGDRAFYDCAGLTSITIPNSVTSIGWYAFWGCTGLTSITIPNSVIRIGNFAFSGCSSLTKMSVNSDNSVYYSKNNCVIKTKSKELIAGCKTSVIPNDGSLISIGTGAFYGCTGLSSIIIPNGINNIGSLAFSDCADLTSITIPESVTSIDYTTFSGTAWYKSQPDGDVYAGKVYYTYKGEMPSGTKIVIKSGTKGIAGTAFSNRAELTSITIPNSVVDIGKLAFHGCTGLTNIIIPNGVISIGYEAFEGCTSLTSLTIPNSVTSIGYEAFEGCTSLTSLTIPNNVTSIGTAAFRYCTSLTNIVIPNGVTRITNYMFYGCSSLKSIIIPNSVTSIYDEAFSGCISLINITIPNSVTNIWSRAFRNCTGLTRITIPKSVTSISLNAFNGCTGLTSLTICNKDCVIADGSGTFPATAKIIGFSGSTAEAYAKKYNRTFELHKHTISSWTVNRGATCTESGSKQGTCSVCKNTETQSIPAIGHSYSWKTDKAATCTENGSKSQHCSRCGDKKDITSIAATGHKFSSWKTVNKATCTKAGNQSRTCSVCKKTETQSIAALGHNYEFAKVKAKATLSKNGSAVTKCKTCGLTSSKTVIYKIKTVKLSASSFVYNGKAKTPTVTVKDSKGKTLKKNTDYTVKYSSGRKNIGTYTVTVTFKGNYSGKKNLKFKIVLGQVSGVAQMNKKGINFVWNKVAGASGYEVYYYDASVKRYVKLISTKNAQLGNSSASGKMTIKIRAFKKVGGKTYYGSFSKPVKFKAK